MQILNQVLVESTNSLSDTLVKDLELEHGTVCDIYSCYTSHEYPDETFTRTTPVTCTVVGKQDHGWQYYNLALSVNVAPTDS